MSSSQQPPESKITCIRCGRSFATHVVTMYRFEFPAARVCDFCREAERRGLTLGTCSVSVLHESDGQFGTPAWRAAYARYLDKWGS